MSSLSIESSSVNDETIDVPAYPADCECPDCLAEANRRDFSVRDSVRDASPEDWETEIMDPIDPIDRAWESGYLRGHQFGRDVTPPFYSPSELLAFLDGYKSGILQARDEAVARINEVVDRIRDLRSLEPEDYWNEAEILSARSNGGFPCCDA